MTPTTFCFGVEIFGILMLIAGAYGMPETTLDRLGLLITAIGVYGYTYARWIEVTS